MVKGGSDRTYLKLRNRFDLLLAKDSDIEKLLTIWEHEGINEAITLYQSLK